MSECNLMEQRNNKETEIQHLRDDDKKHSSIWSRKILKDSINAFGVMIKVRRLVSNKII